MRDGNNGRSSGLDGGTHGLDDGWSGGLDSGRSKLHRSGCVSARRRVPGKWCWWLMLAVFCLFSPQWQRELVTALIENRVAGAGVDLSAMGTTTGYNCAAPAADSTAAFMGSTAAGCNYAAPAAGSTAGGVISTAAGCNGAAPAAGSTAGGEGIAVGREGIVVVCLVMRCLWR